METKMIKANPTREFFVNMLVRDILLKQAIIELIDNSIDGARTIKKDNDFAGLKISVNFDGDSFCIRDNCGGIPLDVAQEYAFRFGRPKEKEIGNNETTGIFGIGMKRALFKLGDYFEIKSETITTSFEVKLDVEKWENEESNNWDFPFLSYQENLCNSLENTGTIITVSRLRKETSADLKSKDFEKELIEHIQRRVGLDIDNGIIIEVNGKKLVGNHVRLVNGEDIQPVKESYTHGNVKVKIVAGIAEKKEREKYEPENAGWYIYCNGRLVVAADKTSLTTWKDIENKNSGVVFTNTYASFQGTVSFSSNKPEELPWNTTKTGIDESSLVYLQAKEKMIDIFKIVKGFIDEIRKNTKENDDGVAETVANMPSIELTTKNIEKVLPENRKLSIKDVKVKTVPNVVIRYKKPKEDVELLKQSLGVIIQELMNNLILKILEKRNRSDSSRNIQYMQLLFLKYKDGAPMLTIGGILVDDDLKDRIKTSNILQKLVYCSEDNKCFNIEVPKLTYKEIQFVLREIPITDEEYEENKDRFHGIGLDEIRKFEKIYRYYPYYTEGCLNT